jgi:hypothetical protein
MDAFNAVRETPKRADKPPHGTLKRYTSWYCRCEECRAEYNLNRDRAAASRYLARFGIDLDDVVKQDA